MHFSIRTKLSILLGGMTLGLSIIGCVLWDSVASLGGLVEHIAMRDYPAVQAATELKLARARQSSALAYFVASKDEKHLQSFEKAGGEFSAHLRTLQGLEESTDRQGILARIEKENTEYQNKASDVISLARGKYGQDAYLILEENLGALELSMTRNLNSVAEGHESDMGANTRKAAQSNSLRKVLAVVVPLALSAGLITGGLFLVRSILASLSEAVRLARAIEEGNLTVRAKVRGNDEVARMLGSLNSMAENLNTLVTRLVASSTEVASSATRLFGIAEQTASGTEQISSQAGTVATAGEEMAVTSTDIARNCAMVADRALGANEAAASGAKIVGQTVNVMHRIADRVRESAQTVELLGNRSDQIGEIIGTIEDIADQTNLLALNAAIEAARAGESGRGFAVVADEVRALAERTTNATREIAKMIKTIQTETRSAVSAMEQGVNEVESGMTEATRSGEALRSILESIGAVTEQVHQIATAAEQQTVTTSEISSNMHEINGVVARTARGADESVKLSGHLTELSEKLQEGIRHFRTGSDNLHPSVTPS